MSTKRLSRRDFLAVAAGSVGVGVMASCVPAGQTVVVEVTAAPPPLEEQEGTMWGLQYEPHVQAYHRLTDLFMEQTGATLLVEPQPWPLEGKLLSALAAGTQPDVFCMGGSGLITLYLQGVFIPLKDIVFDHMGVDPEEDFHGDGIGAYSWGGEIYGVPTENATSGVVNLPGREMEEIGLADNYPPWNGDWAFDSFEDMWGLAKELQIEEDGRVTRWGISGQGWDTLRFCSILRSLLAPEGTDWWDQDQEQFNVDTEAGVEAMNLHVGTPVELGIESQLASHHLDSALAGNIAIACGLPVGALAASEAGIDFEPTGPPRVVSGQDPLNCGFAGWGFVAPRTATHYEMAVEFLRMMVTEEAQSEYCRIYGGFLAPSWKGLVGKYDHFADPSPEGMGVKGAKLFQNHIAPLTRYIGEGFGYARDIEPAGGEVCSLVREGELTAAEAVQVLQERFQASRDRLVEEMAKYT